MASSDSKQSTYEHQSSQIQDKDSLIYLLKSRIFELEQNEKNYKLLNNSHTQLQNELKIANDEKLKTEYEMKQKTEINNKKIISLSSENENFQQIINDKITINKKLYADNELLLKQLDSLEAEYQQLTNKCSEIETRNDQLEHKYQSQEKANIELSSVQSNQDLEIQKLFEDNKKLNSICKEQDFALKQNEQEKIQLISKIEEMNYELSNLKGKLKSKEENLMFSQSQNEDTKNTVNNIQLKLKVIEKENEAYKNDLNIIQGTLSKERAKNDELINTNEQFKRLIDEREREISTFMNDLDISNKNNLRIAQEKISVSDNKDKIQGQLMLLSKANHRLVSEIEEVIDQDETMKSLLQRKDRIAGLIMKNKINIENSLNTFNINYSSSQYQVNQCSPSYASRKVLNTSI